MTDRYYALTVVLEKDMRSDDAQSLVDAIGQLRGVLKVTGKMPDLSWFVAEQRARRELGEKLWKVLYPDG